MATGGVNIRAKAMRLIGGMRIRLTLSYLMLFAIVLAAIGWLFHRGMRQNLEAQNAAILAEEWGALRGYIRPGREGYVHWNFDPEDPEEERIVGRLRQVLLLTSSAGRILEESEEYRKLGGLQPGEIEAARRQREPVLREKRREDGYPFLVRQGIVREGQAEYFLSIGMPVGETQQTLDGFQRTYLSTLPFMLLLLGGLGWVLAGRAMRPVNELAEAARRISGTNLKLRIEPRGSGDELDALIAMFNQMMERLEDSFEQMKQFSIDASHELRTPITAIRGQLEVALFTSQTPEQYQEAIANALQDVERMGRIVQSLLQLSQAESGQVSLHKTRVDLGPVVSYVVQQFQIPAEEKGVRIEEWIETGCVAAADLLQVERLVSNLLSNALKFTPAGGTVRVELERGGETVRLKVTDTGLGIPADHVPHIFERFYRVTHSERDLEKGLGLGLSFVDWIVRAHDGTIEVKSELGAGTQFTVQLPCGGGPGDDAGLADARSKYPAAAVGPEGAGVD